MYVLHIKVQVYLRICVCTYDIKHIKYVSVNNSLSPRFNKNIKSYMMTYLILIDRDK